MIDHAPEYCTYIPIIVLYSTEMANKDGTWLQEMSSCCCLTKAGKTRQLLLNKMYIPFLPSLYSYGHKYNSLRSRSLLTLFCRTLI